MVPRSRGHQASVGARLRPDCGTSSCHGPNGNDGAPNAADHTVVIPARTDAEIVSTMLNGLGSMPPQSQLTDQEVADSLAFVRATYQ